ncbi:MAG: O-antigen ligase family protein [Thermoleophilaceae bacterium]
MAAAAIALLALRGGTYDIVARQEAGIAVWWVLALGFGLGVLPRSRPHPLVLVPLGALVVLGAWTFASLSWTDSDERTLAEGCRIIGYLGLLLLVVSALDRRTWRAAAAGLAAGALLVAALATTSRLAPGLFPTDPVRALSNSRLNYPFNYWNAVGAWGAMAVTAALAWSVSAPRPAVRAAFLAAIPVAALSIYLSYSRAAIGGLVVGLLCVVALSRSRLLAAAHLVAAGAATGAVVLVTRGEPSIARGVDGSGGATVLLALVGAGAVCIAVTLFTCRVRADERWRVASRPARIAAAVVAICLLLAGLVAGPGLASGAWDSFRDSGDQPAVSADPAQRLGSLHGSRYTVWSAALDAYRESSSRGTGAGTFEFTWNRAGRSPEFIRDVHSIYIEPLPELGWPGALFTLAFLLAVAVVSLRALARTQRPATHGAGVALVAVLAVFLVQAGVDWMWEMTAVTAVGLGGAAALWARLGRRGPPPRLPVLARVAAVAVCLAMCLLLVPGLASTSLVRESQRSAADGDLRGAAARADDAIAAAPWAATPHLQRALVAEAAGNFRAARAGLLDAVEREPENWRLPLLLARVEAELGRPAEAIRQFRRARSLRPRAAVFQPALGP